MVNRFQSIGAFFASLLLATCVLSSLLGRVALGAGPMPSVQTASDSTRPAVAFQLRAIRVEHPPSIDGRLDEGMWEDASEASGFTQFRPNPGSPASRPTRVSVLYDEGALYVGARMTDHPDSVVARVTQRDDFGYSDRFFVFFDSYNDDRTAFGFGVTPAGSRIDVFFSDDSGNGDPDWDPVWTAETHIDSLGWTAEFRIPLAQLRYDPVPTDTSMTWGFNAGRDIARHEERVTWAPIDPEVDRFVSLFGSLHDLRGLPSSANLEVIPYTAGTATHNPTRASNPLYRSTEWTGRVGGDLRYGITPNLSLRATVNPDFGQVEADPSRINLTAFETFFPEKRPFFLEGADIFSVQGPQLFYSRRIGREPQAALPSEAHHSAVPDRTTILGAAKLTGRTAGGWEIGALEALTAQEHAEYVTQGGDQGEALVAPRTNYSTTRLQKNMREGKSTMGGILTTTHRLGLPSHLQHLHTAAYAGGLDGRHRFGGETYELSVAAFGSQVRGAPAALRATQLAPTHYYQRPDAAHLTLDSTRTHLAGWSTHVALDKIAGRWRWNAEASATSPGFEINDLGYLRAADELSGEVGLTYVNSSPGPHFRRIRGWLRHGGSWTFGQERTDAHLSFGAFATLQNNYTVSIRGNTQFPSLSTTALRGGSALQENGRLDAALTIGTDERKTLRVRMRAGGRTVLGTKGHEIRLQSDLRYRPTSRASLSIGPSVRLSLDPAQYVITKRSSVDGTDRYVFAQLDRQTFSLTTRASYAFTPKMTLKAYAQPFVAIGDYRRFAEAQAPRAARFEDRFDSVGDRLSREAETDRYQVGPEYSFRDPDFTVAQLRSTLVFKWEYRRGSALHLVWNHESSHSARHVVDRPGQAASDLFGVGRDTFVLKLNYWLGL